jgi:hypothetical protein
VCGGLLILNTRILQEPIHAQALSTPAVPSTTVSHTAQAKSWWTSGTTGIQHQFLPRRVVPAYEPIPTNRQQAMRQIFIRRHTFGDDYLEFLEKRIDALRTKHTDEQAQRIIETLIDHIQRHRNKHHAAVVLPHTTRRFSAEEFYYTYKPFITSPNKALPERCFTYFNEIDTLARQENFPPSLIIATWFKEASCAMKNPDNGDGVFQIVAHDYGTQELTLDELLQQIQDFIAFSRNKRNRYKRLQTFDDKPVDISYTHRSLQDIRKQALLYNGLYAWLTLENARYANNHLWWFHLPRRSAQDGLVVMVLFALEKELSLRGGGGEVR